MLYPTCKIPLSIADRPDIEIDQRPICRGVSLQHSESDKAIERSAAATPDVEASSGRDARSDDRSSYQQHRHRGEQHGKRRRKSFLSDIFEFD